MLSEVQEIYKEENSFKEDIYQTIKIVEYIQEKKWQDLIAYIKSNMISAINLNKTYPLTELKSTKYLNLLSISVIIEIEELLDCLLDKKAIVDYISLNFLFRYLHQINQNINIGIDVNTVLNRLTKILQHAADQNEIIKDLILYDHNNIEKILKNSVHPVDQDKNIENYMLHNDRHNDIAATRKYDSSNKVLRNFDINHSEELLHKRIPKEDKKLTYLDILEKTIECYNITDKQLISKVKNMKNDLRKLMNKSENKNISSITLNL